MTAPGEPQAEPDLAQYIEALPTKAPGLKDLVKPDYWERVQDWLKTWVGAVVVGGPAAYLITDMLLNLDPGWRMLRFVVWCITGCLVAALLAVPATSAVASPPGDWTKLRSDKFVHYACKAKNGPKAKGKWRIRSATWINGRDEAIRYGIGAYGALARGSNRNVVDEQTRVTWRGGHIRMWLNGAFGRDRVWVQGAYYGPPRPWSRGFPVSRITRC